MAATKAHPINVHSTPSQESISVDAIAGRRPQMRFPFHPSSAASTAATAATATTTAAAAAG